MGKDGKLKRGKSWRRLWHLEMVKTVSCEDGFLQLLLNLVHMVWRESLEFLRSGQRQHWRDIALLYVVGDGCSEEPPGEVAGVG